MLKHSDGRVAHLETEYNDLFIDKHGSLLGLSCRYKGRPEYIESIIDLKDPDAMPVPYNRIMPVALAYPQETKRILMIGLGATKLYLSTLVTLHTVFPTVDAYPAWSEPNETQAIAVAVSAPRPAAESLMQRALALQTEYRFRYPLPALIDKRVTELYSKGADVLTDDFAPADLYRVTPIGVPKRKAAR